MNYFMADGNVQKGPFPIHDLIGQGLKRDTLVWREGMAQWQKAETVRAPILSGASGVFSVRIGIAFRMQSAECLRTIYFMRLLDIRPENAGPFLSHPMFKRVRLDAHGSNSAKADYGRVLHKICAIAPLFRDGNSEAFLCSAVPRTHRNNRNLSDRLEAADQ